MHGYKKWSDIERKKTQDPVSILSKAGLKPGMTFVDIGCGQGYFSIPAAKLVGDKGKVYGIDIDAEGIEVLKENASRDKLDNIKAVTGSEEKASVLIKDAGFKVVSIQDIGPDYYLIISSIR